MIPSALVLLVAANGGNASAQNSIVSDGTLSTPTVVTRVDASGTTTYNITGGTLRSNNQVLFHSFSAFGLRQHEIGSFLNGNTVQTIFSRVTGGSPSLIDGLIKANGSANLYLINPQGIIFGPTGAIQVGGSFVATTAQELRFGNEKFLAGVGATGDAPLITANITPGLQFGSGGAQLKVAGTLEVLPGNTIRLAAGPNDSVEVSGALQAPAGSIQIDGGAPITISGTLLNVNNGPGSGGSISLQGSTVTLQDGGKVISRSTDGGSGAAISVDTGTLNLLGGSQLISESSGGGAGGSIQLNSSNPQDLAITFSGDSLISTSTSKTAAGGGKGGDISIGSSGKTLTMSGPGVVIAETRGSGEGGKLDLQGSMVSLDRVLATTQTSGSGKGGQINLSANSFILNNATTVSALTKSAGEGGSIAVDANSLSLNFSQLRSEAHSTGQGGTINLFTSKTPDLTISFGHFLSNIASQTTQTASSGGEGGDITIGSSGKTLTITGLGSIAVETYGSGGGGVLNLKGSTISLDQTFASTQASGSGNGGQINFSADSITLSDGAAALALTSSSGAGGLIAVDTGSLSFSGKSRLTAEARGSGAGGGITIAPSSVDALRVSGPGTIETGTTSSATAGTIRIGSSSTTSTTVDNGVQIKASGPNARVDLLSSGTTTFQGDSSVEATGGLITVSGSTKATISGGSLNATNNGAITVQGGDIAVGSATGRTLLLAGKGALAVDGSESETKAPNLTLLDSSISLNAGAGKSIEVFSGTTVTPGSTTLRAVGADGTNVADAKAVRLTSSGVSGSISVGGRSSAPATPVTTTTIGDGVAITATDGSLNFTTRGNFALGVGSQLAAKSIKIKATSTDPITTPLLDKIAGSSSWLINQDAVINAIGYMPTPDRSLSVEAAGIKVGNFSLNPAKASWEMVSGTALDLLASGAHGLDLQNLNLSFSRTGAAGTADLFRAKSSAGNTSIDSTSTIHANGDGFAVGSSKTTTIAGTLSTTNTGTSSGGSISLEGASVVLTGNGKVNTSGSGDGAAITVKTGLLDLAAGSQLSTESSGSGTSGAITVAPSSAAALTVNGPGLIQSQASGNGKAGAISIGSSTTTATTAGNGVQIKASGSSAKVELLSSGTTTFQGGGSIEATGGAIKLDGADTTISGGSLTANQGGSITVNGSTNAEVSGGSLQADGGNLKISGQDNTKLDSLSSLTANGGTIQVLSTGTTSSSGKLEASSGSIKLDGANTTISGGSLTANQGGSITVNGSSNAEVSGGSLQTDGGTISISGVNSTALGNTSLIANSVNSGGALKKGQIVVGGSLSGSPASAIANSNTTTLASGAKLSANGGGRIDVLSTGHTSSTGNLEASGGVINLAGDTSTISGGSLTADQGGSISVNGSTKASISGGSLNSTNSGSSSGGSITLEGATVSLTGTGKVNTTTSGSGAGAAITVKTGTLDLAAGAELSTNSTSDGISGAITVAPTSNAALTVKGPGLIQSQASGNGKAGAISIGSSTTTATTAGNGVQIKASGTGAMVDLLSSGATTFQGDSSIEATGGAIKLDGVNTTIKGGSLMVNQGGSITVNGSSNAEVSGGSLQADGGTLTISGVTSTTLGNTSLIANSVNSGGALKNGQIVVGGSLSGSPASAIANSNTTTLASGAKLSANGGGRIDVLSTGRTSSTGNLEASGGVINLAGDTSTISGGSLTADQGGSITVNGSTKASISGGSLSSTNSGTTSGGAISLEGATVSLTGTGKVNTTTSGSGAGAAITVKTGTLDLASGTELSTKSSDSGTSGAITVTPSSAAALTVNGPGLIQSQASGNGKAGAISIGSSTTTTATTAGNGVQIKANGTGAAVDLLSSGTTSFQGGGSIEATGGSIKLDGADTTISGGSLTANQGGSIFVSGSTKATIGGGSLSATNNGLITVQGGEIAVGSDTGRTILLAGNGDFITDSSKNQDETKTPNLTLLDGGSGSSPAINLQGGENKTIQIFSGSAQPATAQGITSVRGATTISATPPPLTTPATPPAHRIVVGGVLSGTAAEATATSSVTTIEASSLMAKKGGSISVVGGKLIDVGSTSGRTILLAGNGDFISDPSKNQDETKTPNLTLLDGGSGSSTAITLKLQGDLNINKNINVFSETQAPGGTTTLRGVTMDANRGAINIEGANVNNSTAPNPESPNVYRGIDLKFDKYFSLADKNTAIDNWIDIQAKNTVTFEGVNLDMSMIASMDSAFISITASNQIDMIESTLDVSTSSGLPDKNAGYIYLKSPHIRLSNSILKATTDTSGKGGSISINSQALNLENGSQLTVETKSKGQAGDIKLFNDNPVHTSTEISFVYSDPPKGGENLINARTTETATGKGGNITIGSTNQALTISGPGKITAETKGSGEGGFLDFKGTSITLDQEAIATSQTSGIGKGGTITINSPALNVNNGAQLTVETSAGGQAGDININDKTNSSSTAISFGYKTAPTKDVEKSLINARTTETATGKGGNITIGTTNQKLTISGPGKITAETQGSGEGGFLDLKGSMITLDGGAKATTETSFTGFGGWILVDAEAISLKDGSQINSQASAIGNAGFIEINNKDNKRNLAISFSGQALDGSLSQINALTNYKGILNSANPSQQATGGNISIGTANQKLTISGPGKITAETKGSGEGGFLDFEGSSITLDQGAIATSQTSGSGKGGTITINSPALNVNNRAQLTVETSAGGQAGDININDKTNNSSTAISFGYTTAPIKDVEKSLINAKTSASGNGGNIIIGTTNRDLTISGLGKITAETKGSGQGGFLDLKGTSIRLDQSIATTETSGLGNAGTITVKTNKLNLSNQAQVNSRTSSTGNGGLINLNANSITLSNESTATAQTSSSGKGGVVWVDTSSLNLYGASKLTTEASGTGNAGEIFLNANIANPRSLAIVFTGQSAVNASTRYQAYGGGHGGSIVIGTASTPSLVVSGPGSITAETEGWGAGGSLDLNANSISFNNGSIATTQTTGSGRGGSVQVQGNTIVLDGQSRITAQSGLYQGNEPGVSTPTGPAGSITITASGPNSLHLFNGSSITVATNSSTAFRDPSDLGDISIRTPYLDMKGGSLISAKTDGAAQGGTISLEASRVDLDGGSRIRVDGPRKERSTASGTGQAGNINLTISNNLSLTNLSGINASTTASNSPNSGANIIIWVGGDLLLSGNSSITAAAYGLAKGGNILLRLPNGFLRAAFPVRGGGNDILATAEYGSGGLIDVSALGVIGFNFTSSGLPQPISQLSTRAASGRNGVTAIYTPNLDPDRGVVPIEQPIDPSSGLDQSCSPRAEKSSFQTCGRGGVPALPGDSPGRRPPLDDLGPPPVAPLLQPAAARSSTLH